MTGSAFNTCKFFPGVGRVAMRRVHAALHVLAFGLPALLLAWALMSGRGKLVIAACGVQALGLLAERWLFFAQARHPQNLYYQVVS